MKQFLLFLSIFIQITLFAQDIKKIQSQAAEQKSFYGNQDFNLRGYVYDKSNGDAISFQKVKLLRKDSTILAGAVTDLNGIFSIPKLSAGEYIVKVDNQAYELFTTNITFATKKIIDITIEISKLSSTKAFDEIRVTAENKTKRTEIEISKIKLDQKGLERIPSYGAENDIVGAFSVTPGVITTGDQGGQLYVRGGTPIQNKVLLDGMTIYNPFHSIGFFSIFETELVKNVDIYTGGFESKYGGRISSVMDITYRDGNRKEFGGKLSTSPFLAKLVLEGPIGKIKNDKPAAGSYIFSA